MTATGYKFAAACGACGAPLEHVTGSGETGSQALAVCRCTGCGVEWVVSVFMRRLAKPDSARRARYRERLSA